MTGTNDNSNKRIVFLLGIWAKIWLLSTVLYAVLFLLDNYKFTKTHLSGYVIIGIAWTYPLILLLNLSALTILFNLKDKVRKNNFFSFLSFYLLPIVMLGLWIFVSLIKGSNIIYFNVDSSLAFLLSLTVGYLLYRRRKRELE